MEKKSCVQLTKKEKRILQHALSEWDAMTGHSFGKRRVEKQFDSLYEKLE